MFTFNYFFLDMDKADMFEMFVKSMSIEFMRDGDNIKVIADAKAHQVLAKKALEIF